MRPLPQEDRLLIISPPLAGRRVLLIEEEPLVSMMIEDVLADQQSIVIGPFKWSQLALEAARSAEIDIALLDGNLGSTTVRPVAEALSARKIPFLLLSDNGSEAVPDRPGWRLCCKPFSGSVLVRKMIEELEETRQRGLPRPDAVVVSLTALSTSHARRS